jgi:hypothetical protein
MASYLVGLEPTPADAAPLDYGKGVNRAEALLREGLVIPVLDGFDELPVAARAGVLKRINGALRAGRPLILASRPAAYRAAVTGPAGVRLPLNPSASASPPQPPPKRQPSARCCSPRSTKQHRR